MLQRFHKLQYQELCSGYVEGSTSPHEHATSNLVQAQQHTQYIHAPATSQTNATPSDSVHHDMQGCGIFAFAMWMGNEGN
eukprot:503065-Ditylum_brightwellii.AAC.1